MTTDPTLPQWRLSDLPAHLAARIRPHPCGCWLAQGYLDKDGYASFRGRRFHRTVWEELAGPIEPGMVLDHVKARGCLFNACCWPGHLEPVTHRVNTLRGRSFAAVNAAKHLCDHGHEYDLFNTYWRPDGHRDCRACIRARVAAYKRRRAGGARVLDLAA